MAPLDAEPHAVAGMSAQLPGAVNGDALPFNNIEQVLKGYNVYYADPAPPPQGGSAGGTRFCVVSSGSVRGAYCDIEDAKTKLKGIGSGSRMICEVSSGKAKSDPHSVGGQNQGGGSGAGFNKFWWGWSDIHKMSAACESSNMCTSKQCGAPAPDSLLNVDPGLRKPVFLLEYTRGGLTGDRRHTQPDGYHATVDAGCSTVFTSKSIRDEYEYTKETANEVSLSAGVEASVGVSLEFPPPGDDDDSGGDDDEGGMEVGVSASAGASVSISATATLSHKDQEIRKGNELRDQRMEKSVAQCASYVAAIEFGNFPKTHPDFQKAVGALVGSAEKHWDLFDEFGTHFLTTVKMGARYSVMSYFRNDQYDTMKSTLKGFGVDVGVAASATAGVSVCASAGAVSKEEGVSIDAGVEAGATLLAPKEKKAVDAMKQYVQKQEVSALGPVLGKDGVSKWVDEVRASPVPIRSDRREICMHPAFKGSAKESCQKHLKGYCDGRLKARGAPCKELTTRECMNDLECKEDHLCRDYKCKPAPVCLVTLCAGSLGSCGSSMTLEKVMHHKAAQGREFNLKNADWWDRVSSLKLSSGCARVEAVDDDGQCRLGKGDNRNYGSSANLPYDLDNDVCMIKVWAKDLPGSRRLSPVQVNDSADAGALTESEEVPGLAEVNRLLAQRWKSRQSLGLADSVPALSSFPADASRGDDGQVQPTSTDRHRALQRARAKLRFAAAKGSAAGGSLRRLSQGAPTKGDYIKNVGKAMYGYNHFYAAPLSAEFAGTDPGFQHRAVWEDEYKTGAVASHKTFTEIPKYDFKLSSLPSPGPHFCVVTRSGVVSSHCDIEEAKQSLNGISSGGRMICEVSGGAAKSDPHSVGGQNQGGGSSAGFNKFWWNWNDINVMNAACDASDACAKKTCSRRRLADNATAVAAAGAPRALLAAGPPRMLADGALKVPDGWKVTMGQSTYCEKEFHSNAVKSSFGYQQEMKDSFSMGVDIGFVSFGASGESREFVDRSGKERKMMVTTKAECIDYVIELEDLENKPPPTSPSFEFVVAATRQEAEFYVLFDMFGLHFPAALAFGSRYGFKRYIDEQNYKSLREESDSTSITAGVSYTVGVDKGAASAGITVSAEVGNTKSSSSSIRKAVKKYFEETREFSVGKRMPDKGGVAEWIKNTGEEPMPIRFALVSICQHPAFAKAGNKQQCLEHAETYCVNHLQKISEDVNCFPEPEPECLWDLDCKSHHTCNEGSCVPEPACEVTAYKDTHQRGSSVKYGPIYRRERPGGQVFDLGWMEDEISSLKISGGCEEVVLMDEDKCREVYEDNDVVTLRRSNSEVRKNSIWDDLDNDVCKVKVLAKDKWA